MTCDANQLSIKIHFMGDTYRSMVKSILPIEIVSAPVQQSTLIKFQVWNKYILCIFIT